MKVTILSADKALEEQRNGEWRYLEFLQVTSWITAEIFGGLPTMERLRAIAS